MFLLQISLLLIAIQIIRETLSTQSRHGQSAALQLIFAALGPLLEKQHTWSIKTHLVKNCTYFFSKSIKKKEIVIIFEQCGPRRKIIFKFGPRSKRSGHPCPVTYYLNRVQGLVGLDSQCHETFFVFLNSKFCRFGGRHFSSK